MTLSVTSKRPARPGRQVTNEPPPPTEAGTVSGPTIDGRIVARFPSIRQWNLRCRETGLIGYSPGVTTSGLPVRNDLLRSFLKLTDASDDAVYRFAERYCVLGLCPEHGLPYGHDPVAFPKCKIPEGSQRISESFNQWRQFAALLANLRSMAMGLAADRYDAAQWKAAERTLWADTKFLHPTMRQVHQASPQTARGHLAVLLNRLLSVCHVAPSVDWKGSALVLRYAAAPGALSSLPAVLGIQLLAECNAEQHSLVCHNPECRVKYASERRPRRNGRHYCPECVMRGIPGLIRQREKRARDASGRCTI